MIASLRLPFAGRVSGRDGMIVWMRDGEIRSILNDKGQL